MGSFGGCGNDSCLWIILVILVLSSCCNNNNTGRSGGCGCGCSLPTNNGCCCD